MKVNIILNKTNFYQIDENFDIIDLTYKEIENLRPKIYEMLWTPFSRNGMEYTRDKGVESINIIIVDYPLNMDWENDEQVLKVIENIDSFFEVNKVNSQEIAEYTDLGEFNKIIEVDTLGSFGLEEIAKMHDIFDEYGIEYSVIYESTYERNIGASTGGLRALFKVISDSANTIAVLHFLKRIFQYDSEAVEVHDLENIKQEISEYYKIHESQLDLESIDYNEQNNRISYVFSSREYNYYIEYESRKLVKTSREEIN